METKKQPKGISFITILLIVLSIASLSISTLIIIKTFSRQSLPANSPTPLPIPIETPTQPEEKISCGGFAGKKCPSGYVCEIEAKYPDAMGSCEKESVQFTCPPGEWVNCMPGPNMGVKQECTSEYINWAREKCPNFKGGAL